MREAAYLLTTAGSAGPTPKWDRDYICGVTITFSGLTVATPEYGAQPWFEPAYQCFADPGTRASIRAQKKAAKDRHLILEYFNHAGTHIYDEPGQWLQPLRSTVGEDTPAAFRAMVLEVLADGLVPLVVFDGDNGMNPVDGAPNALRQLPGLVALLADVAHLVLFGRLWDGVFYGATPESIQQFGQAFRRLLPEGYLAIEHNPGHIPVGNGPADYEPGGMMTDYDVIMGEYDWPAVIAPPPPIVGAMWNPGHGLYAPVFASDATAWMNIWQVLGRTLVNWTPPADEPFDVPALAVDGPQRGEMVSVSADSRHPVCYLQPNNPRGPYVYVAFEDGEYQWVRNQVTLAQLQQAGRNYRAMGAVYVGLPR